LERRELRLVKADVCGFFFGAVAADEEDEVDAPNVERLADEDEEEEEKSDAVVGRVEEDDDEEEEEKREAVVEGRE
jgi:hypothetical protein